MKLVLSLFFLTLSLAAHAEQEVKPPIKNNCTLVLPFALVRPEHSRGMEPAEGMANGGVRTSSECNIKYLSIDNAVQQALKRNKTLNALSYDIQARKYQAKSAFAGYYPSMRLESTISRQKDQNSVGSETYFNTDQLVYSFAGPLQKYHQAKNITAISKLDKAAQSNLIRLNTAIAFLQAWLLQEQEGSNAALESAGRSAFQRQQHKNKLKQLDKQIWLKDAEGYAQQLIDVQQYQEDKHAAFKKLEFFMGDELKDQSQTKLVWHHKKNYRLQKLETYYHHAITSRPEVPRSLKKIAFEHWNVKLAQGQRLPTISANVNVGFSVEPAGTAIDLTPTAIPEVISQGSSATQVGFWSLGLSFKWPIFDGLVSHYQEQQAEASRLKEMLEREQVILDIKQEVYEAYYDFLKMLKKLKIHELTYLRKRNEFKLMEQKFTLGRISRVEFDCSGTSAWQKARLKWLAATIQVALAEQKLMYACGYPSNIDTKASSK